MKTTPAMMLNLSLLALISSCGLVVHAQAAASPGWVTAGANPQRTSWVPDAAPGALKPIWVKPVEPYISQKVQIIAASGKLFLSTARGLYAFDADTGADLWVYPTELPLGHSPTYAGGRVYVGGLDRKIHAIDADTGQGLWTFSAAGGFHTSPLVVGGLVYAGSRDGCMYAVDASTGELVWKHQTGGQILQSAAYQDGVIFFGSQDARAYALDARTGTQVWQSDKLPGMGWHSWWPVIYKDVVLFTRTEVEKGLVGFQNEWLFSRQQDREEPAGDSRNRAGRLGGRRADGRYSHQPQRRHDPGLVRTVSLAAQPDRSGSQDRQGSRLRPGQRRASRMPRRCCGRGRMAERAIRRWSAVTMM